MINLFQFLIGLFLLSFLFFVAQYLLLQVQINVPPALLGIAVLFCGLLWIKGVPKVISNAANPLLAAMGEDDMFRTMKKSEKTTQRINYRI